MAGQHPAGRGPPLRRVPGGPPVGCHGRPLLCRVSTSSPATAVPVTPDRSPPMVVPLPPDRSPPERCHSFPPRCRNASRYQVLLGATQLSNPGPQACYIRVVQVVTNPLYAGEASSGDVALLHLAKAVTFTRYVSPICLPGTRVRFPPGLNCWVTGWGNLRCCGRCPVRGGQTGGGWGLEEGPDLQVRWAWPEGDGRGQGGMFATVWVGEAQRKGCG